MTSSVIRLLSREYVFLALIAAPVAWYAMNEWLEGFPFRTSIGWLIFVQAGLFTLVIPLLTVSCQVVKASQAKPVDAIRNE